VKLCFKFCLPGLMWGILAVATARGADRVLLEEDFSGQSLSAEWQGRRGAFKVVDGVLRGVCAPGDSHGPAIGRVIDGRDLIVEFDVKIQRPGYFLFLIDGDSQFGGQAHLLRFSIGGMQYQLAQDRGDPASKLAQKKEREKRGGKRVAPTPEQLADPAFYRVERLAARRERLKPGQWEHVRIELRGNNATVQYGQREALKARGTVWDTPKSRVVFLVGQAGEVWLDNVKVTSPGGE